MYISYKCLKIVLTVGQWFSIEEPLNLHVRITNRSQLALELGTLHFNQSCLVLDLSDKPTNIIMLHHNAKKKMSI
jgi:hypothetical protein